MKLKKNFLIGIIVLLILCIIIISLIFFKNYKTEILKNKEEVNSQELNETIIKDQNVDGIIFKDIHYAFDNYNSIIEYTILNNTDKTVILSEYEFVIKNEIGNILAVLAPDLGVTLAPLEEYRTGSAINLDLRNGFSIEVKSGDSN